MIMAKKQKQREIQGTVWNKPGKVYVRKRLERVEAAFVIEHLTKKLETDSQGYL